MSRPRAAIALVVLAATAAGCGGQRLDAKEPKGTFKVRVQSATFPARQSIAAPTQLKVSVVNDDHRALPDAAVTVQLKPRQRGGASAAFDQSVDDPQLADSSRPVWIVDRGPMGADTAYTDTWASGPLQPGETRTFTWQLTPVQPGSYTLTYRVSPGLNGKARAAAGHTRGTFQVVVDAKPVPASVDANGNVVRGRNAAAPSN